MPLDDDSSSKQYNSVGKEKLAKNRKRVGDLPDLAAMCRFSDRIASQHSAREVGTRRRCGLREPDMCFFFYLLFCFYIFLSLFVSFYSSFLISFSFYIFIFPISLFFIHSFLFIYFFCFLFLCFSIIFSISSF